MMAFRNRLLGRTESSNIDPGTSNPYKATSNGQAVAVMYMHRHATILSNVLGTPNVNTVYEDTGRTACHDMQRVFYIGTMQAGNGCFDVPSYQFQTGVSDSYDAKTYTTLIRAGNWDTANKGIVNPVTLPKSLYMSDPPAWWGTRPWPAFDANNGAAIASSSTASENIPAGYCYAHSGGGYSTNSANVGKLIRCLAGTSIP
jgi:hypothetical protein